MGSVHGSFSEVLQLILEQISIRQTSFTTFNPSHFLVKRFKIFTYVLRLEAALDSRTFGDQDLGIITLSLQIINLQ